MSFTDRKPFQVSQETIVSLTSCGRRFLCALCGHTFTPFDTARWIFANFEKSPVRCGNFFVCCKCDAEDKILLECAKISFEEAVEKAKRWNIYGPEWNRTT